MILDDRGAVFKLVCSIGLNLGCPALLLLALGCSTPTTSVQIDLSAADESAAEVIRKHQKLTEENPSNGLHHGELGIVYELHGYPEAAINKYEDAIEIDPTNPKWHYFRALLVAQRTGAEHAVESIDQVLELDDLYIPAWLWRGTWMMDLARSEEAEFCFNRARDLGSYLPPKIGLARISLQRGDSDAAIKTLEELVNAYQLPYLRQLLGVAYSQAGRSDEAKEILSQVHDVAPIRWRDPWVEEKLKFVSKGLDEKLVDAQRHVSQGNLVKALELLASLRSAHPDSMRVARTLATVLRLNGDENDAIELLAQVLENHPTEYMLHVELAQLLIDQGKFNSALDSLQQAISIDPNVVVALKLKGEILMKQKKWSAAKNALMLALKIDSTNVEMIVDAGWTTGMLNQWEEAANLFQHAIFIDRNYVPAYLNLARALAVVGNFQDARNILDEAVEIGAQKSHVEATRNQIDTIQSGRS